ncbi:MAG: C40 family peptidase [Oscillospiraceae bacterium]|jgi:cell wall-associated NlpC family hydrolase|nr:C40 family peptidase [Oscillospiraceae bacterium]
MAKTAVGLVEHAKAMQGSIYMWGTYGKKITTDLITRKKKQYPDNYTDAYVEKLRKLVGSGKRAVDCNGLIKSYMFMESPTSDPKYAAKYDTNVGGMKNACTKKGPIGTLPEIAGLLLFRNTSHVGIYMGDGKVIEAKGSDQVLITEKAKGSWTDWGQLSWIEYPAPPPASKIVIKAGDKVKIKPEVTYYYPGGVKIPASIKTRTFTAGSARERGGNPCVLLVEIESSCWIENLIKL